MDRELEEVCTLIEGYINAVGHVGFHEIAWAVLEYVKTYAEYSKLYFTGKFAALGHLMRIKHNYVRNVTQRARELYALRDSTSEDVAPCIQALINICWYYLRKATDLYLCAQEQALNRGDRIPARPELAHEEFTWAKELDAAPSNWQFLRYYHITQTLILMRGHRRKVPWFLRDPRNPNDFTPPSSPVDDEPPITTDRRSSRSGKGTIPSKPPAQRQPNMNRFASSTGRSAETGDGSNNDAGKSRYQARYNSPTSSENSWPGSASGSDQGGSGCETPPSEVSDANPAGPSNVPQQPHAPEPRKSRPTARSDRDGPGNNPDAEASKERREKNPLGPRSQDSRAGKMPHTRSDSPIRRWLEAMTAKTNAKRAEKENELLDTASEGQRGNSGSRTNRDGRNKFRSKAAKSVHWGGASFAGPSGRTQDEGQRNMGEPGQREEQSFESAPEENDLSWNTFLCNWSDVDNFRRSVGQDRFAREILKVTVQIAQLIETITRWREFAKRRAITIRENNLIPEGAGNGVVQIDRHVLQMCLHDAEWDLGAQKQLSRQHWDDIMKWWVHVFSEGLWVQVRGVIEGSLVHEGQPEEYERYMTEQLDLLNRSNGMNNRKPIEMADLLAVTEAWKKEQELSKHQKLDTEYRRWCVEQIDLWDQGAKWLFEEGVMEQHDVFLQPLEWKVLLEGGEGGEGASTGPVPGRAPYVNSRAATVEDDEEEL